MMKVIVKQEEIDQKIAGAELFLMLKFFNVKVSALVMTSRSSKRVSFDARTTNTSHVFKRVNLENEHQPSPITWVWPTI